MGYTIAPEGWWKEFVAALPARTAKLAVVRKDGSPLVLPVWVDIDGDDVMFTTGADTAKGKAILRDPRVCLCWDDDQPPFHFVTLAGTVSTSTDPKSSSDGARASQPGTWGRSGPRSTAAATRCRPRWWCG